MQQNALKPSGYALYKFTKVIVLPSLNGDGCGQIG
jgi:hypothetical protein